TLARGGMDLHLFRPAVDSKGFLYTNGTDVLGDLAFSFGLIVDGGFGLLPYTGFVNDGGVTSEQADHCRGRADFLCGRMVDFLFTGTLQANLGLFNLLVVGVQMPLGVFAAGPNVTIPDVYNLQASGGRATGLDYQGVGGLSAHVKARILRGE